MTEWIYFIHSPREDFAATITPEEQAVWVEHFERLQQMLADGRLIVAGPTLGTVKRRCLRPRSWTIASRMPCTCSLMT